MEEYDMNNKQPNLSPSTAADPAPKPAARPAYRVVATACQALCVYVEAESSCEAFDIASRVDGFYFKPYGPSDWEIDHAELVIDSEPLELLPKDAYDSL